MDVLPTLVPLLLVGAATVFDFRRREIPDTISLMLLGWAVAATAFDLHDVGWGAMGWGFLLGGVLGALLFRLGGFGGGDVKLLAALGAALGFEEFLRVLFFIAIAGGVLSVVALVRGKRDLAYGPAIALGLLFAVIVT
jgi:prepilin peptidase CpaA